MDDADWRLVMLLVANPGTHLRELATFFGAQDYDSHSHVVKDGVASDDEDHARLAEEIGEAITVEESDHKLH